MSMNTSTPLFATASATEWIDRCVARLLELDPQMPDGEARELARAMFRFQRTAAMTPEAAVDFAAAEMSQAQPRLERRAAQRD